MLALCNWVVSQKILRKRSAGRIGCQVKVWRRHKKEGLREIKTNIQYHRSLRQIRWAPEEVEHEAVTANAGELI
jgi:hypothetical protein